MTKGFSGWDQEGADPKILEINDMTVYYSQYENTDSYIWNDGHYSYRLTATEDFILEEIESLLTLMIIDNE